MTSAPEAAVRLGSTTDVAALMELEARYYVGNLDPAQRADGFVSILHSARWFHDTVADGGIHVAEIDGDIAGFIAVTPPPNAAGPRLEPIIRAVVDLAEVLDFRGAPIARQRWAFRGPVLIDRAARGRGVYTAFNDVTRQAYRDRYDVGVLFVAADNPRSLHTTTTKLGAQSLAEFDADDRRYHFLAYAFDGGNAGPGGRTGDQ
ncbi:MAG: hypothetical protein ACKOQ4_03280 [Mycobacterium sp.]